MIKNKLEFSTLSDGKLDLSNFAGELLPNPDTILVSLGGDLKNYSNLKRDDQVHSLLEQRQDALIACEWEVDPASEEKRDIEAADFLREQLKNISFDSVTRKMHNGLLYGYSVAECIWENNGKHIILKDIKVRKSWRFGFGKEGELKLLVQSEKRVMPEKKFWIITWNAEDDDNHYGVGLGYHLWWPCYLKRNGAKFWSAFLDKYGIPSTKASYPISATEEEKKTALAAARALRSESAIAMPQGFEIQLIEATHSGNADFQSFLKYWDDAIAKVLLGQTGTTQQGQYAGTGEVLEGVKTEKIKADADLLCESLNNSVVTWLTEWNFPNAKPPKVWRKVENKRKLLGKIEEDKALYEIGLELSEEEVTRRFGDAWVKRTNPHNQDFAEKTSSVFVKQDSKINDINTLSNQVEEVINSLSSKIIEEIYNTLEETLSSGGDLSTFSTRITELYPFLQMEELTDILRDAFVVANLQGRLTNE